MTVQEDGIVGRMSDPAEAGVSSEFPRRSLALEPVRLSRQRSKAGEVYRGCRARVVATMAWPETAGGDPCDNDPAEPKGGAYGRTNRFNTRPIGPVKRSGPSITAKQMHSSSASAMGAWSSSSVAMATSPRAKRPV